MGLLFEQNLCLCRSEATWTSRGQARSGDIESGHLCKMIDNIKKTPLLSVTPGHASKPCSVSLSLMAILILGYLSSSIGVKCHVYPQDSRPL